MCDVRKTGWKIKTNGKTSNRLFHLDESMENPYTAMMFRLLLRELFRSDSILSSIQSTTESQSKETLEKGLSWKWWDSLRMRPKSVIIREKDNDSNVLFNWLADIPTCGKIRRKVLTFWTSPVFVPASFGIFSGGVVAISRYFWMGVIDSNSEATWEKLAHQKYILIARLTICIFQLLLRPEYEKVCSLMSDIVRPNEWIINTTDFLSKP